MMRRVVDQHQMGKVMRGEHDVDVTGTREIPVAEDVAIDDEEGLIC
jgi:hypothetical protein